MTRSSSIESEPFEYESADSTVSEQPPPLDNTLVASLTSTRTAEWDNFRSGSTTVGNDLSDLFPFKEKLLPEVQIEGLQPPPPPDADGKFEYDAKDRISKITYPDGKTRSFGRDDDGNLNSITTKDARGERTYVKENGKWQIELDGMKVDLPGDFTLTGKGDFSTRVGADGTWKTERPDGTTFNEKSNATGSRVALNSDGQVEMITRKDGSTIEAQYENGSLTKITETTAGSASTTWTKDGDHWISDGQPPQTRKNIALDQNGNTVFEGSDGLKHIIRGNGSELTEGPGRAKFSFDKEGRIDAIEYPDGRKVRGFGYEGDSGDLNRIVITDRERNTTKVYTRSGADSDVWTVSTPEGQRLGEWRGQASIGEDGVYSLKANKGQDGETPQGHWRSFRTDGVEIHEAINGDGSRAMFDTSGQLRSVRRSDGSTLDSVYTNGQMTQIIESDPSGEKVTWTKQDDKTWTSDSPKYKAARKNLNFNKEGEITFNAEDGSKHTLKLDGSEHVNKRDGSKVELDRHGVVRRTSTANGDWRSFDYEDGKLSRITESTKQGGTNSWDPRADQERTDVILSADGDLSYGLTDGSAVIDKSNFQKVHLNSDGNITQVVNPNGSSRQFTYDGDKVTQITDTRKTDKGDKVEVWTREGNSDRFISRTESGKVRTRDDVQVCRDGDIEYRTNDKRHVSRSSDLYRDGRALYDSADVEEARANLESMAEQAGMNAQRLAGLMDAFEKRCQDGDAQGMKVPDATQIVKTYDNLSKLLQGSESGRNVMDNRDRATICEQALHNIAYPRRIDQGGNPTCNITTGEIYIASRRPEHYTDLCRQIAISGEYTGTSGQTYRMPSQGMRPGREEASFNIDTATQGGGRNWASKLIQIAGINTDNSWRGNYTGGNPHFGVPDITKATKELCGDDMPYIGHNGWGFMRHVTEDELMRLKETGNFPAGVVTLGSAHVQTIHDVRRGANGQLEVLFDDQHGESNDRGWCSLSDVHSRQGGGGMFFRRRWR